MTVTQRVSQLLKEKNCTQLALAECIGYSKSTVNYVLTKGKFFSADDVINIANFFDVSVHYLLTGEEEPVPPPTPEPDLSSMLSEDERELVSIYRSVDREGKTAILYNAYQTRGRYKAVIAQEKSLEDHAV